MRRLLTIALLALGALFGALAVPASAHTIGYEETRLALRGNPGDNDIRIKWDRLEEAFDVNLVESHATDQVRVSDHLMSTVWQFTRANGEHIYRIFDSRFTENTPNRWISDAPELPY